MKLRASGNEGQLLRIGRGGYHRYIFSLQSNVMSSGQAHLMELSLDSSKFNILFLWVLNFKIERVKFKRKRLSRAGKMYSNLGLLSLIVGCCHSGIL